MSNPEIGALVGRVQLPPRADPVNPRANRSRGNVAPLRNTSEKNKPPIQAQPQKFENKPIARELSPLQARSQAVVKELTSRSKPVGKLLEESKQVLTSLQNENARLEKLLAKQEQESTSRIQKLTARCRELELAIGKCHEVLK